MKRWVMQVAADSSQHVADWASEWARTGYGRPEITTLGGPLPRGDLQVDDLDKIRARCMVNHDRSGKR